jgi:F-type H+-transporting ATPase subunit a
VTRRLIAVALGLFLALPAVALAADQTTTTEKKFDPSQEWNLHAWIPIHIGPIDMSINKAVAYLLLGALLSCLLGIFLMRVKTGKDPDRKQALGEIIYEVARVQVAEQGLPVKAMRPGFPTAPA